MAPLSRDERVVAGFEAALRGNFEGDEDESVEQMVTALLEARDNHEKAIKKEKEKEARLEEFRSYGQDDLEPTPAAEADSGDAFLPQKVAEDANTVAKRKRNTEAARKSRAKKAKEVKDLEDRVKELETKSAS